MAPDLHVESLHYFRDVQDQDALKQDDLGWFDSLNLSGPAVCCKIVDRDRRFLASLQAVKTASYFKDVEGVWVIKVEVCMEKPSCAAT